MLASAAIRTIATVITTIMVVVDGVRGTAVHPVILFRVETVHPIRDRLGLVGATTAEWSDEAALYRRPLF
jgi:hypothetical protein